jgi:hypothetical protein
MFSLDDNCWLGLKGGYKLPYDPRPVLRQLETGGNLSACWEELWNELHHQGDLGEASYAAVPHLVRIAAQHSRVDWNFYALVGTIEIERHRKANPPVPGWLWASYDQAWRDLPHLALRDLPQAGDPVAVTAILGTLALAKGQLKLGAFILHSDPSEVDEWLEEHSAWSEIYSEQGAPPNSRPR